MTRGAQPDDGWAPRHVRDLVLRRYPNRMLVGCHIDASILKLMDISRHSSDKDEFFQLDSMERCVTRLFSLVAEKFRRSYSEERRIAVQANQACLWREVSDSLRQLRVQAMDIDRDWQCWLLPISRLPSELSDSLVSLVFV